MILFEEKNCLVCDLLVSLALRLLTVLSREMTSADVISPIYGTCFVFAARSSLVPQPYILCYRYIRWWKLVSKGTRLHQIMLTSTILSARILQRRTQTLSTNTNIFALQKPPLLRVCVFQLTLLSLTKLHAPSIIAAPHIESPLRQFRSAPNRPQTYLKCSFFFSLSSNRPIPCFSRIAAFSFFIYAGAAIKMLMKSPGDGGSGNRRRRRPSQLKNRNGRRRSEDGGGHRFLHLRWRDTLVRRINNKYNYAELAAVG